MHTSGHSIYSRKSEITLVEARENNSHGTAKLVLELRENLVDWVWLGRGRRGREATAFVHPGPLLCVLAGTAGPFTGFAFAGRGGAGYMRGYGVSAIQARRDWSIDLPVMTFAEVEASPGPFSCRVVVRSAARAR